MAYGVDKYPDPDERPSVADVPGNVLMTGIVGTLLGEVLAQTSGGLWKWTKVSDAEVAPGGMYWVQKAKEGT